MNRSWSRSSNSSPGFVYFQQDDSSSNHDTQDFLSFGNSPNHSSPKKRDNFSPSFYSSPRFNPKHNHRYMGQNPYYSEFNRNRSYNSSNDSFGSNDSFRGRNKHKRKLNHYQNSQRGGRRNMSSYLDSSFTADPWEELERIDSENQKAKEEVESVKTNENKSDDSTSSEDETDSVSEKLSSSSTAEEETT